MDVGKVGGRVGVELVEQAALGGLRDVVFNLASESSVAGNWRATDLPRKGG